MTVPVFAMTTHDGACLRISMHVYTSSATLQQRCNDDALTTVHVYAMTTHDYACLRSLHLRHVFLALEVGHGVGLLLRAAQGRAGDSV